MWLFEQLRGPKSTDEAGDLIQPNHRLLSHYVLDISLQLGGVVKSAHRGMVSSRFLRECASISWAVSKTYGALFGSGAVVASAFSRERAAAAGVEVARAATEGGHSTDAN